MPAQGQAAYDLDAFDKSEKMADIRSQLQNAANEGEFSTVISDEDIGLTRDSIMAATILRLHNFKVTFVADGIEVKW